MTQRDPDHRVPERSLIRNAEARTAQILVTEHGISLGEPAI